MNPANFYYGYNQRPFPCPPQAYMYPQMQHNMYGYPTLQYPDPLPIPLLPPSQQMPLNPRLPYGRPSMNNLNMIPPHPRRQVYRNIQNEFSRGFEFDYDFLPSDSTMHNSQSHLEWDSPYGHTRSKSNNTNCKRLNENSRKNPEMNKMLNPRARIRSRSFKTSKIIKSCQRKMTKAGILFTAIIYSVCDCLFVPESNSFRDLTAKLLQAIDGSRLDLSKLMLPHDRLLTEESIEDLEFEILENRANRLEKEDNSFFMSPSKKRS